MSKVYRICRWLVEKLKEEKYLNFKEIEEEWLKNDVISDGRILSERSFHRYRDKLRAVFGIEIGCKQGGDYPYFISNPEVLKNNSLGEWMLNTLAMDEKLTQCLSIIDRIIVEEIPSGGVFLDIVTDAIMDRKKLIFEHLKYGSREKLSGILEPYCVVLHNQRWFVLGKLENAKLYTFALDRLLSLEISKETFVIDPTFCASDYFKDIIGIYNPGVPVEHIVFRAFDTEPYYLRDLPLHRSQREIGSGEGYTDFVIDVRPNKELIATLLYKRERVKVLSPASFVEEMKAAVNNIKNLYE